MKHDARRWTIRSAEVADAGELSALRYQIDGETEYLDREQGEAFLDETGFRKLIEKDAEAENRLFLVAESEGKLVGFARCEGMDLKRKAHQAEFGVVVSKEYWGCGIGRGLLETAVAWADRSGIVKLTLSVLAANQKAVELYKQYGFVEEGRLRADKRLADGYYDTLLMARFHSF
ncbi:UNVERIFIED_CONTAM: GNAT family N-acetyltransferase [Halobacillus marinus]